MMAATAKCVHTPTTPIMITQGIQPCHGATSRCGELGSSAGTTRAYSGLGLGCQIFRNSTVATSEEPAETTSVNW